MVIPILTVLIHQTDFVIQKMSAGPGGCRSLPFSIEYHPFCIYVSLLFFGSGKYCAAGNLTPGVSGRLCCEIIRVAVDNDSFAYDICNRKAVGKVYHPCKTIISEQRRHVAFMSRMRAGHGIIMAPGVCIRVVAVPGAGAALVNVEAEDVIRTVIIGCGKTIEFCVH